MMHREVRSSTSNHNLAQGSQSECTAIRSGGKCTQRNNRESRAEQADTQQHQTQTHVTNDQNTNTLPPAQHHQVTCHEGPGDAGLVGVAAPQQAWLEDKDILEIATDCSGTSSAALHLIQVT